MTYDSSRSYRHSFFYDARNTTLIHPEVSDQMGKLRTKANKLAYLEDRHVLAIAWFQTAGPEEWFKMALDPATPKKRIFSTVGAFTVAFNGKCWRLRPQIFTN